METIYQIGNVNLLISTKNENTEDKTYAVDLKQRQSMLVRVLV